MPQNCAIFLGCKFSVCVPCSQAACADANRARNRWIGLSLRRLLGNSSTRTCGLCNGSGRIETVHYGRFGFYEVARYATGTNARWSANDQTALVACFRRYLGDEFYSEIVDCDGEDHLSTLSDTLESIGNCCGINVQRYLDNINERISELASGSDDDDHEARQWEGSGQPTDERTQEAEVKRLFDGLRSKPAPATP